MQRLPVNARYTPGHWPADGYSHTSTPMPPLNIPNRLAVVGAFGSGKSEVATNCAIWLARAGQEVTLIDLDTVTPALRSRQIEQAMADEGVELLAPSGQLAYADLPAVSAAVRSALADASRNVVIDVGGHPNGARTLGSLSDLFIRADHAVWGVVSPWRPETRDPESIRAMMSEISSRAGLAISALVANLHAPCDPTPEDLRAGAAIVREAASLLNLGVAVYAVESSLSGLAREALGEHLSWLDLELRMRAPWDELGWIGQSLWNPPGSDAYGRSSLRGG